MLGVPIVAQWKQIRLGTMRLQVRSLASLSGLLWLWGRLAAVALIRPLAWEPPCATGVALRKDKKTRKEKRNSVGEFSSWLSYNKSD